MTSPISNKNILIITIVPSYEVMFCASSTKEGVFPKEKQVPMLLFTNYKQWLMLLRTRCMVVTIKNTIKILLKDNDGYNPNLKDNNEWNILILTLI